MGATEPGALEKSAENMIGMLKEDQVNAVFLTPVLPNCTRAVGGLARYIEEKGISTVQISLVREHSEK